MVWKTNTQTLITKHNFKDTNLCEIRVSEEKERKEGRKRTWMWKNNNKNPPKSDGNLSTNHRHSTNPKQDKPRCLIIQPLEYKDKENFEAARDYSSSHVRKDNMTNSWFISVNNGGWKALEWYIHVSIKNSVSGVYFHFLHGAQEMFLYFPHFHPLLPYYAKFLS